VHRLLALLITSMNASFVLNPAALHPAPAGPPHYLHECELRVELCCLCILLLYQTRHAGLLRLQLPFQSHVAPLERGNGLCASTCVCCVCVYVCVCVCARVRVCVCVCISMVCLFHFSCNAFTIVHAYVHQAEQLLVTTTTKTHVHAHSRISHLTALLEIHFQG